MAAINFRLELLASIVFNIITTIMVDHYPLLEFAYNKIIIAKMFISIIL